MPIKILLLLSLFFLTALHAREYPFTKDTWIHEEVKTAIKLKKENGVVVIDGEKYFTGYRPTEKQYEGAVYRDFPVWEVSQPIPEELDFTKIAPPNVVRQPCNDCWAQGAAMAFEGVIGWLDRASRSISRQAIIDCSGFGTCARGGEISVGFFMSPKGAVYTSDYPQVGRDQRCQSSRLNFMEQARSVGMIRGSRGSLFKVEDLQRAIMAHGPLEVCGASSSLGGFDRDGFISKNRRGGADHCWAMYGWLNGVAQGKPKGVYGIFVNSWGKNWGKDGIVYLRLAQDDVNLDGGAVTEAAFIDYKDAPNQKPETFEVVLKDVSLTVTVQPDYPLNWEKVKERLSALKF